MTNEHSAPKHHWQHFIVAVRDRISLSDFEERHRMSPKDFTRKRILTFPVVLILILQKTAKSVQRHLHLFFHNLLSSLDPTVTPGGWTQARAKLSHTAFIELNQEILLPCFYAPEQAKHRRHWRNHRLLGGDGSILLLPSHPDVIKHFGFQEAANHYGKTGTGYATGRLSVLYDLLNHIGLDAALEPVSNNEVDMLAAQLKHTKENDVLIWDRGFSGFVLMAQTVGYGRNFIGRCSKGSFGVVQELFRADIAGRSVVVKLSAPQGQRSELKKLNLGMELTVRFVTLRLSTGELEVLATSLLDEAAYPTEEFLEVYHFRWNHETYHQMLKGRLDLENWSGLTLEAVRQDLQAAIFICNVETLLSQEAQAELSSKDGQRQYCSQVNRAVSYHALKEHIWHLLLGNSPLEHVLDKLKIWMQDNPVSVRPNRRPPRRPQSLHRSYAYQRYHKKTVF